MAISTAKLEAIKEACENFIEPAENLLELREDPEADPDEKFDANEEVASALSDLKLALGIK